jgi:hypothetical protein
LSYCIAAGCALLSLTAAEHHGQVKFNGLPVPGATVTAVQGDKKLVAITDPQGDYAFPNLADGVWNIQVEMLCFAPQKEDVAIAPGAPNPTWELKLLPFDEIKASAPPPPPPTVSSPTASAATPQAAAGQPTPSLAATLPPAKPGKKAPKNGKAAAAAQVNPKAGFQRTDVNATPNAASNTAPNTPSNTPGDAAPPPGDPGAPTGDANQTASDAFVVNGSVSNGVERRAIGNARKGPGSMYRGDVSFIMDNSNLDARTFSITGQDTAKPAYDKLRAGASFGGPLLIPHLLHGNGQFFINYQLTRNSNANTAPGIMPDAAERSGDLSHVLNPLGQPVQIVDPLNGAPFPGNLIPQNRISPQAAALLNLYPLPNFVPSGSQTPVASQTPVRYNYQIPIVDILHQDDFQGRANKMLNNKNFVNGQFAYRNSRADSPNILGFLDTTGISGMTTNAGYRHIFSQRVNLNINVQYSRFAVRSVPYFADRFNVSGAAGITGNNQEPGNWGPPTLSFASGIQSLSDGLRAINRNQTVGFSPTLMWIRRPHNITMGMDYRRQQFNALSQQNPRGTFAFTGGPGQDFTSFLLGIPDASSIAFGNADKYFRSAMWDAYFTDDWRIGPSLTINAGMRWEYGSPITEKYGRLVNLDIAPGWAAVTPVLGSAPAGLLTGRHFPDSLVHPDKHGFEPRIALAWHPFFGSSMVIRAGYGVYYNTSVYQAIAMQMAQQSPLSKSLSVANGPGNPLTLANGFNAAPGSTPNTFAIDPDFLAGYSQNWQASVQRDLLESMVITATYLGIKGTRAVQVFLPNTVPAGAANPCPACPSGFAFMTSNGNSTREAGQLQLRRRLHNGFTASVQYTYAKAFDNAALGGRGQGSSVIAQNWLDLSAERGPSSFDQRHQVNFQGQFTTGIGVAGGTLLRGWKGAAWKGWTFVANIIAGSGMPLSPTLPTVVRGTGVTGTSRPDVTGAALYAAPVGLFLNPAAYTTPAAGQWGDAGRNSIVGPGQFVMNASMGRSFGDFDVRFDSTNVLNHVTFPNWNTVVGSANFGLPNTANGMRNLQATVRWRF